MRKKHQSVFISSSAKKNLCNEISLSNYTYESEVKEQLRDYFNNNISDEDVEISQGNSDNSSDDDKFEVSQIKVPKQEIINDKEYAKCQISENAAVSGLESFGYEKIPQKTINIHYDEGEYNDENNKDIGASIKFLDIIKQYIFWKEKDEENGNKVSSDIDCFEMFNIDNNIINKINKKINEIRKIGKGKKFEGQCDSIYKKFLDELEGNFIEQKNEIKNLISNLEYIDSISYGKKWSVVYFQKVKFVNKGDST